MIIPGFLKINNPKYLKKQYSFLIFKYIYVTKIHYCERTYKQEIIRESLRKIQELGINPYPAEEYLTTTTTSEIKKEFSEEKNNFQNVRIAGRIMGEELWEKLFCRN